MLSIVKDLREALQDVVAPELKAVVQGLAELRTDVREGNAALRAELAASEKRSTEHLEKTEQRLNERIDRVHDAVKIADLTRRNAELESELQEMRKARKAEPQQH